MGVIFKNNVMYGAGDIEISPVCYSEEERKVGCWVDGKPLYQKTIIINSIVSGTNTINHEIDNVDKIVHCIGIFFSNAGNSTSIPNGTLSSTWSISMYDFGVTNFKVSVGSDWIQYFDHICVTIQYTKTTDTPGSGIWTPSGVPAVHYSTEEQIIGTWVDGKTLYEKTIDFGYLPNSTTKDVAHNISNIDKIWISEGFVYGSNGWCTFVNLPNDNLTSQWHCFVNNTYIEFWAGIDRTDRYAYVVVQYTKTTS